MGTDISPSFVLVILLGYTGDIINNLFSSVLSSDDNINRTLDLPLVTGQSSTRNEIGDYPVGPDSATCDEYRFGGTYLFLAYSS